MAGEYQDLDSLTFRAAADMRTNIYHVVQQTTAGLVRVSSGATTSITNVMGVLVNKPNTNGHASVAVRGVCKVVAASACAAGALVAPNGSGRIWTALSGNWVLGQALDAASASGEQIRVLLDLPAKRLTY